MGIGWLMVPMWMAIFVGWEEFWVGVDEALDNPQAGEPSDMLLDTHAVLRILGLETRIMLELACDPNDITLADDPAVLLKYAQRGSNVVRVRPRAR